MSLYSYFLCPAETVDNPQLRSNVLNAVAPLIALMGSSTVDIGNDSLTWLIQHCVEMIQDGRCIVFTITYNRGRYLQMFDNRIMT